MMSKLTIVIPLLFSLLTLNSCASYFARQECERTDWYRYGHEAAMDGRRLSGDHRIRTCEDAGSNVDAVALDHGFKEGMSNDCQPETVLQTGKKGDFFNDEMCGDSSSLKRKHAAGVRLYCQKANGYSAGTTGRKYNGICPKELEAAFLSEFNRGRKNYLSATIASNESALGEIEIEIGRLEGQKFLYQSRLMAIPPDLPPSVVVVTDPNTGLQTTQQTSPPLSFQTQRSDLEFQIQSADSRLSQERQQEQQIRATTRDLQVEMTVL